MSDEFACGLGISVFRCWGKEHESIHLQKIDSNNIQISISYSLLPWLSRSPEPPATTGDSAYLQEQFQQRQ